MLKSLTKEIIILSCEFISYSEINLFRLCSRFLSSWAGKVFFNDMIFNAKLIEQDKKNFEQFVNKYDLGSNMCVKNVCDYSILDFLNIFQEH
jgi:hypothetical protein